MLHNIPSISAPSGGLLDKAVWESGTTHANNQMAIVKRMQNPICAQNVSIM